MKIFKIISLIFLAALLSIGCKKESDLVTITTFPENNANLKVIYASAYTFRDSVQIKINDVRVSNTFLGNSLGNLPTPFPGGGMNTGGDSRPFYLSVKPGLTKIFVSVPNKLTTLDSIIRFSGEANLEANRYYSAYLTDTMVTSKLVLVEDNLAPVDTGISRFKFVNLIPNRPALDVYFGTQLVAANVAYGTASNEFTLQRGILGAFLLRPAGALPTSVPVAAYPGTVTVPGNFTVPNQRVMTVFAKGYIGGTVARVPIISLLFNR